MIDGSASLRTFSVSDASFFVPGSALEISLRYEGRVRHGGLFRRHRAARHRSRSQWSLLSVIVKGSGDLAHLPAQERGVFRHGRCRDHQKLLEGSDVSASTFEKTPPAQQHGAVPLHGLDFILSRADALELGGGRRNRRAIAEEKALSGSAVSTFEYGINPLYEFEAGSRRHPSQMAAIEAWPGTRRRR